MLISSMLNAPIDVDSSSSNVMDCTKSNEIKIHAIASEDPKGKKCFSFFVDIVKTIIVLMCLYTLYFGVYFVCVYFSMKGHHALLGWFIFFLVFKLTLCTFACCKLCKKN